MQITLWHTSSKARHGECGFHDRRPGPAMHAGISHKRHQHTFGGRGGGLSQMSPLTSSILGPVSGGPWYGDRSLGAGPVSQADAL